VHAIRASGRPYVSGGGAWRIHVQGDAGHPTTTQIYEYTIARSKLKANPAPFIRGSENTMGRELCMWRQAKLGVERGASVCELL
jgi:hypothetical protein